MADWEAIVVGFGPTGQTAANLLGAAGVRTLVLEREREPLAEPRAVATDDEVLRIWQRVGLADAVLARALVADEVRYESAAGRVLARVRPRPSRLGFPWPVLFHQPDLEAVLRAGVARCDAVEVRRGWEVESVQADGGEAVVRAREPATGRVERATARWLLGCDGARSAVRKALGIPFRGRTAPQRWLVVDGRPAAGRSGRSVVFRCDPRRPAVELPLPEGRRRWELMLRPGEEGVALENAETARRLIGEPVDVERARVYAFHARVAQAWSAGPVFLLGDAAHATPPFAGQGLSAGVRDAGDLAWKLALVRSGRAHSRLLDTYERERRPRERRLIRLSVVLGALIQPRSRAIAAARDAALLSARRAAPVREWLDTAGPKPEPRVRGGLVDPRSGRAAGRVLPQPWVRDAAGRRRRLDDALGDGFALVGAGLDPAAALDAEARARWAALGGALVAVDAPATGDAVSVRTEAGARLGPPGCVLLVRPDRFVFGAAPPAHAAALVHRLYDALGPVN